MGLWLVGRRPVLSKRGYFNSPDLNATFMFVCPRSPRLGLGRFVATYVRTPS
jgi:hypothetical protein